MMSIEDPLYKGMGSRRLPCQRTQKSADEGFMLALSNNTGIEGRQLSANVCLPVCLPATTSWLRADYAPLWLSLP